MGYPRYSSATVATAAAAPLIVEHELKAICQAEKLGEQILVVCSRAAMEHQQSRSICGPVAAPVEWDFRKASVALPSGGRNGEQAATARASLAPHGRFFARCHGGKRW